MGELRQRARPLAWSSVRRPQHEALRAAQRPLQPFIVVAIYAIAREARRGIQPRKWTFFWVARCKLPSWVGYLDRSGPYGSAGACTQSDGAVDIVFAPEGRDTSPLTDPERALAQWFVDRERSVSDMVKAAIIQNYSRLQQAYSHGVEGADHMPEILSPKDLERLVGLYAVNVHQIEKDATPYLGFELGCTWDEEHGLGVLMHGLRVIEVGGADTAILLWLAERDAERG
jgi:hypothetical protein